MWGRGSAGAKARRRAAEILGELHLSDKAHRPASGLSYGEERRVGLARALAVNPRFLLLDEPAAGLAAAEAEELRELILHIRSTYGCGVLVIEHNMALVMNLCERIHVLDGGKTIAAGTPAEIRADAGVRRAYLGPERLQ
jgi:branched-chain amino acid transport system ATP-binding protein